LWQAQSHRTAIKGRGGRIPGTSAADLIAIPAKLPVIECPAPSPRSEGESVAKAIYSQPICNATAKPSSAGTVKAALAAIGIACVADRVSLRQTPKGRPHPVLSRSVHYLFSKRVNVAVACLRMLMVRSTSSSLTPFSLDICSFKPRVARLAEAVDSNSFAREISGCRR
jgi:hypothetical protein